LLSYDSSFVTCFALLEIASLRSSMPKLFFRHGTVTSRKSLELLCVRDTYLRQKRNVLVLKPGVDTRDGWDVVSSRVGLSCKADIIVRSPADIRNIDATGISACLVDEAQFLSAAEVDELWKLSDKMPVIAYGLRTDFQTKSFEGSRRLMELADKIQEIKTTCTQCNKKANFNLRTKDGKAVYTGDQIELGKEDLYASVCREHYRNFNSLPSQERRDLPDPLSSSLPAAVATTAALSS